MKYYMKSKIFKIKEDFWIRNKYDEEVYLIDNKFFTFGLKFDILKNNKVLYTVEEKLFTFMSNYEIFEDNKSIAKVYEKLTLFREKLSVTSKYGNIIIKGDYFDYNYEIYKDGHLVAKVAKELFAFTDNYFIDINFEDEAFILCLVVIIDNIIDKDKQK